MLEIDAKRLPLVSAYDNDGKRKPFTRFDVGTVTIGNDIVVIAGPCSVESEEQIMTAAKQVKAAGANILRGGAFKPRTSPYDFQGLGEVGLSYLKQAGMAVGMPIITEVVDTRDVAFVAEHADILQIGARNMQNFTLLTEVGKSGKPVLLKRGMGATIEEWLHCAEYIVKEGNHKVILCERGIRTFETYTRNTLDLSAVPVAKELTHLPVFVDPSHALGRKELIKPMSLAAVCAGCDGLMIEVHPEPEKALSDGAQQLTGGEFGTVMKAIKECRNLMTSMEE
ncbi:3-deoxy-D-arabinoheptulosonate-7-phosphate synthase [Lachnospiraceae bacterium XBB1006]|nr:3-deoxy-D-arabinoheptulosonate-7-phosphate synthase [Lachnospiraceae bacterium XBB1006]